MNQTTSTFDSIISIRRMPERSFSGLTPLYTFGKLLLQPYHKQAFPYVEAKQLIGGLVQNGSWNSDAVWPIIAQYKAFLSVLGVFDILALIALIVALLVLCVRCSSKRRIRKSTQSRLLIALFAIVLAVSSMFLISAGIIYVLSVLSLTENIESNLAPNVNGQLEIVKDFSHNFSGDVERILDEHIALAANATAAEVTGVLVQTIGRLQRTPVAKLASMLDAYKQKLQKLEQTCESIKVLSSECRKVVQKLEALGTPSWLTKLNQTLESLKGRQDEFYERISAFIARRPGVTQTVQNAVGQLNATISREIVARINDIQMSVELETRTARAYLWIPKLIAALSIPIFIVSVCLLVALVCGFAASRRRRNNRFLLTSSIRSLHAANAFSILFFVLLLALMTASVFVAFFADEVTSNVFRRPKTAIAFVNTEFHLVLAPGDPVSTLSDILDACEQNRGILSPLRQKESQLRREAMKFVNDFLIEQATHLSKITGIEGIQNLTTELLESNRTLAPIDQRNPDRNATLGAVGFIVNELDGGSNLTTLVDAGKSMINSTVDDIVENAGRCRPLFDVYQALISVVTRQLFDELHGVWLATGTSVVFSIVVVVASPTLVGYFKARRDDADVWAEAWAMSTAVWPIARGK